MAGALLATSLPLTALATAPHLTCGPKQVGRWETIKVPPFRAVPGLDAPDRITAYTVDRARPQDVAVTNGVLVQVSHSNGCGWDDAVELDPYATSTQSFVGSASSIVSVGLLQGKALAAVRSGTGATSSPHVLRYDGTSWASADSGLPATGAPRLLRAATDGRTAYLTISPTSTGGSDDGTPGTPVPLPSVPPLPVPLPGQDGGSGGATGLLYATVDGGATWQLRTAPGSLPNGGTGFSQLEVDPRNANWLYGLVNGQLIVSRDGGTTFTTADGSGYTAITPMFYGAVAAFDSAGHGVVLYGTHKIAAFPAPQGITSAAYRDNDSMVMVESNGVLRLVGPFGQGILDTPAPRPARRGSLLGDSGVQSSFHAVSDHNLLRFVDPITRAVGDPPPLAAGDAGVTPPLPGVVTPSQSTLNLMIGQTASKDFTLALPKNPTPLDLFFLVDVSTSMATYIDNLKKNIHKVVDTLTAEKVDVRVGIGTLGTAPAKGEAPYPDAYAYPPTFANGSAQPGPTYHKPRIYQLLRKIGDPGSGFDQAINSISLETDPPTGADHQGTYHEGQLLALEQAVTGSGVKTEQDVAAHSSAFSAVRPGQQADFRPNPDVRRIIVLASDEAFDVPYGTPQEPGSSVSAPLLDFSRTLRILNDNRVGVFGITAGSPDSVDDMTTLARGTRTFSPPGGVSCGGDPEQELPSGAPLVCSQDGDFSQIIATVLARLTDKQDVSLVAPTATSVLRALDASRLRGLDVKRPNAATFGVTVSCAGVQPGTYQQDVVATLRGYPVGRTRLFVNCLLAQAAVPPVPLAPPPARPPVAPAVQPPPPPPAPPPAAQPQPQPNPNVNPLTAGVTQEQEEIQLSLALQQAQEPDDEVGVEQLAMVDRRKQQEVQALGVLAIAMTACAGLGLARLRTRTEVAVRRAR